MACSVSGYSTAAGSLGGRKRKVETPTGLVGIDSTVSRPSSRRVREPVKRCCTCTRHLTCFTMGSSARACKCRNAGRKCTGCYCWGWCKNQGWLMPSPTTARGLLGDFPRSADPPAADQIVSLLPVQLPTSLSLQAILAAGARGGGARYGAGRRRSPRDNRGGGRRAGRRNRDGRVTTRNMEGAEREMT